MKPPSESFLQHLLPPLIGAKPLKTETDMGERYTKLAQQFAKVMAISDKYQSDVIEMAECLRRSKEELEETHTTLRQSEERFRALSENLSVGVVMVNSNMETLAANPKVKQWFPEIESDFSTFGQSLGGSWADFPLCRTWEDGETRTVEQVVPIQKHPRHFRITATTVVTDSGAKEALILMIEDVTERKRIEEERKEHEERERNHQKTESLHRMAGAIAHHFNNQLHVVMGHLELALSDSDADGTNRKTLEDALHSARTAAEMSVLMRRYVGEGVFSPSTIDLTNVCRQQLATLRELLPPTCELHANLPEAGPVIRGEGEDIGQILTNLVTNAGEACEATKGGRVHVSVESVDSKTIPLARCFPVGWQPTEATCACLTVSDNGPGIAKEDISKIFEPFFSRKFTGRGLGLALVAGLIRRHDGAILVESAPGKGSIFRCYFPVSESET